MKKSIIALLLIVFAIQSANADLISPNRPLFTLETEFFTIIFPEESRPSAEYLASFADNAYKEIAAKLGTDTKLHIPVVITPDTEETNGYFTNFPYIHIVLYSAATKPNDELGCFEDDLYKLFYHELTHAVSLSIMTKAEKLVTDIFGDTFSLPSVLAPKNFVEGVTVSLESQNGYGRALDPLFGAIIRQDIIEGKSKSYAQSNGAYDLYPWGKLYYLYGGYFSKYLQDTYGMEKYQTLWKTFSLHMLEDGVSLKSIYGKNIEALWKDFIDDMAIKNAVYLNTTKLTESRYISTIKSTENSIIYADYYNEYVYELENGKSKKLFNIKTFVDTIDVSKDNSKVLISTSLGNDSLSKLHLLEFDRKTKKLQDLKITKTREAAYLGDIGIVGIDLDGYETSIKTIINNKTSIILKGTEKIAYSNPIVSKNDSSVIYAQVRESGINNIIKIKLDIDNEGNARASTIEKIESPETPWIRFLSVDDDETLRFSWNDKELYRLAELKDNKLSMQTVSMSGGVYYPTKNSNGLFYLGNFSDGKSICKFPEDRTVLGFEELNKSWQDASYLLDTKSVYDKEFSLETKKYNALPYLFNISWLPALEFASNFRIKSLGIDMISKDPIKSLELNNTLLWNFDSNTVDIDFSSKLDAFNFPINTKIIDDFSTDEGKFYRQSYVVLSISDLYNTFTKGNFSWSLGLLAEGLSSSNTSTNLYDYWNKTTFAPEASLAWENYSYPHNDKEAKLGFYTSLYSRLELPFTDKIDAIYPIFEAELHTYLRALNISLYGAYSPTENISYSTKGRIYGEQKASLILCHAWNDFSSSSTVGNILGQGEIDLRLINIELQKGSYIYLNRLAFNVGTRGYIIANTDIDDSGYSIFARAKLVWGSGYIGSISNVHVITSLEAWYRPNVEKQYGITFNLNFIN